MHCIEIQKQKNADRPNSLPVEDRIVFTAGSKTDDGTGAGSRSIYSKRRRR